MKVKTAIKNAYRVLYDPEKYPAKKYDYSLVNDVTTELKESNAREEGNQFDLFKEMLLTSKKEYVNCQNKGSAIPRYSLYAFLKDKPDLVKAVGKLLGKVTNLRVHPAAVVVSAEPLTKVLPLSTVQSGNSSEKWVTSFDGPAVEATGQVKLDILGLLTLNAISACIDELRKHKPDEPIIKALKKKNDIWLLIEPNDSDIFAKFAAGDTEKVFQYNTDALKSMCVDVQVSDFNDMVAIVALDRPGPLKAGFDKLYIDRKFDRIGRHDIYEMQEMKGSMRKAIVPVKYSHPMMDEVLKQTYGVVAYQEQVQQLFIKLGGFTPIESNNIRKAISKGKKSLLFESKPKFLEYATNQLSPIWTPAQVDAFYEDIIGFGSYCFNKSHSVAYGFLGYVCQYLKTKYPLEWWVGNLRHAGEKGIESVLNAIQNSGLAALSEIDINRSKADFYYDGVEIVKPLSYIDGVGDSALKMIIGGQPFTNLEDFVKRMPGRSVRKNCVVNLIVTGAFSKLEPDKTPQQLIEYFYKILKKEKIVPVAEQLVIDDMSEFEKRRSQADPFYKSDWVEKFKKFFSDRIVPLRELEQYTDNAKVFVGGQIDNLRYIDIKKGKNAGEKMCFMTLRQANETVRVTLWPNQIRTYQGTLDSINGKLVEIQGTISRYKGEINIQISSMKEVNLII